MFTGKCHEVKEKIREVLCSIDQSGKTSLRRWYLSGESSEGSEKATCGRGEREMVPAIAESSRRGSLLCSSKNIKWTEVARVGQNERVGG